MSIKKHRSVFTKKSKINLVVNLTSVAFIKLKHNWNIQVHRAVKLLFNNKSFFIPDSLKKLPYVESYMGFSYNTKYAEHPKLLGLSHNTLVVFLLSHFRFEPNFLWHKKFE